MYNGGIRLIECTYDASGFMSDEEVANNDYYSKVIKYAESSHLATLGTFCEFFVKMCCPYYNTLLSLG
jgi:hypothetical protein